MISFTNSREIEENVIKKFNKTIQFFQREVKTLSFEIIVKQYTQ